MGIDGMQKKKSIIIVLALSLNKNLKTVNLDKKIKSNKSNNMKKNLDNIQKYFSESSSSVFFSIIEQFKKLLHQVGIIELKKFRNILKCNNSKLGTVINKVSNKTLEKLLRSYDNNIQSYGKFFFIE